MSDTSLGTFSLPDQSMSPAVCRAAPADTGLVHPSKCQFEQPTCAVGMRQIQVSLREADNSPDRTTIGSNEGDAGMILIKI